MRTLAFDGRMGASGDMLLAALLAAGADRAALAPVEAADRLDVRYDVGETTKNGIRATTVTVRLDGNDGGNGEGRSGDGHDHAGRTCESEDADTHHEHPHDHHQGHDHTHDHAEGAGPSRSYAEVLDVVGSMDLPRSVESDARAVFELLGEAEAAVHGTDLESTHFHEVGADDAIADVVGVCLLLDDHGAERVVTTPVAAGGGEVSMSHGTYPVPAPAVLNLAAGASWELEGGPVEAELLTPTGAALLAHFAEAVESLPPLRVERVGYGAGGYDFPEHPNVLRATVGESSGSLVREGIRVLETNLDDATPETIGSLQETLAEAGARDVTVVPTTMKKARPGHLVKVVVKPGNAERVARRLAEETGTLGVRDAGASHRWIANRRFVTTTLLEDGERYGVPVKVASDTAGAVYDVSAEHDDALAVARETGLPVRKVARRAELAAREGGATDDPLLHVLERDRWNEVGDAYRPDSLDAEGFVHLSTADSILAVAQYDHADAVDPVLLAVDPAELDAEIRYEETPDGAYPHIYGPVSRDAVVEVLPFPREDGRYVLPEALR
ncbi:nickel pincer cofactor biosynthesis protein LarC [Halobacteriales archaeon QS_5_70_15]|nr:MAG: nickel pincer cofactor biosynthesis protein LarC [Halobacteriales archaeon QS_5_70_15]